MSMHISRYHIGLLLDQGWPQIKTTSRRARRRLWTLSIRNKQILGLFPQVLSVLYTACIRPDINQSRTPWILYRNERQALFFVHRNPFRTSNQTLYRLCHLSYPLGFLRQTGLDIQRLYPVLPSPKRWLRPNKRNCRRSSILLSHLLSAQPQ